MSARAQSDRRIVALAAVSCGRLSGAASVRAGRGQCTATADGYRVVVTEPGAAPQVVGGGRRAGDGTRVVAEHWGGDAELLALRSPVAGAIAPVGPRERALVAARTVRYYALDSLQISYPDGGQLRAGPAAVIVEGPRAGWLRRRRRLLRAAVDELR